MSQANEVELEMLALINAERADAGLNPLLLNTALNEAAEDHSAWMLDQWKVAMLGRKTLVGKVSAAHPVFRMTWPISTKA